jgi:hypothetical protein
MLNDAVLTTPVYYPLGQCSRVESSRCPFCRLVKRSYFESIKKLPSLDEEIGVEWSRSRGPSSRGAFFPSVSDSAICFAATGGSLLPRTSESEDFYLKETTGAAVDIAQIQRWMSRCDESHTAECWIRSVDKFAMAFPGLEVLRLIDVERKCIVEVQRNTRYIALSYVWGAVFNFRLTKVNRTQLLLPGSLEDQWDTLPRTIQDAITLVHRIGEKYLWVDSLCLLQNDSGDLDRGVNVMDLIYERAWLTIVASYGHDANAGLPGVQRGSRKSSRNIIQVKPGIALGVVADLDRLIKTSVYNSRAWT